MIGDVLSAVFKESVRIAKPEIRQFYFAVGIDHYVVGFYVAVDDAVVVPCVVERQGYGLAYQKTVDLDKMLFALQQGAEIVPVDILHHIIPEGVRLSQFVAFYYAWMVDFGHCLLLGLELFKIMLVGGEFFVEDFYRHDFIAAQIHSLPDAGHASFAYLVDKTDVRQLNLYGIVDHRINRHLVPRALHFLHGRARLPLQSGHIILLTPRHSGHGWTLTFVFFLVTLRDDPERL